jgi:hypothetical protein
VFRLPSKEPREKVQTPVSQGRRARVGPVGRGWRDRSLYEYMRYRGTTTSWRLCLIQVELIDSKNAVLDMVTIVNEASTASLVGSQERQDSVVCRALKPARPFLRLLLRSRTRLGSSAKHAPFDLCIRELAPTLRRRREGLDGRGRPDSISHRAEVGDTLGRS